MQKHRYIKYGLWLSEEENQELQKICDRTGMSRATVLRRMIMSRPIKERPHADFISLGVNFNQLVRKANATGVASESDLREAKRTYQRVLSLMREWEKTWL